MIKSKNMNRIALVLITLLGKILFSCEVLDCEECKNGIPEELEKIGSGDFGAYKRFMKKHPDPYYKCCYKNSIINAETHSTKANVRGSGSLEIIKDFFTYDLSQSTKNEFLNGYWRGTQDDITKFLIDNGAKLDSRSYCDSTFLPGLKNLHKLGYDMNYVEPISGRNLFLDFSAMGYENEDFKDSDCAIECLKYLKSIGADTQLKDADGKTALEIASDPKIISYLKSI